jgi:hypothetical protein
VSFEHAPPPTTVDGLLAVPIDVTSVTATLTFDAANRTASGTATMDFVVGPTAGCGIFDLRQTITSATLDGAPIPPAQLAHHDFGGGFGAQLRVIGQSLPAGSAHTLAVTYDVAMPSSPNAQPIGWDPGSARVTWDTWFSDLYPGRYLEMWAPANLVYDPFPLTMTIRVLNAAVPHRLFTNGTVTASGASEWTVSFPAHFTALSPMLFLVPEDRIQTLNGSVTLAGGPVALETVKLTSGGADLSAVNASLASYLVANEAEYGSYPHGGRFVTYAWDNTSRSMEYDGATTSTVGALRHEVFHSWWGRGVRPARAADGWLDEGFTSWARDDGAPATAFPLVDPVGVPLCPRDPFVRVTPNLAYTQGSRFFAGLAHRFGVATVRALMADFWAAHAGGQVTTEDLLVHLLVRTGEPRLVSWFAHWVYGAADAVLPDLWLRDETGDPGADAWGGAFWDSPDLWVRNADDGGTAHQDPEFGQDNWFYARVRNRGASTVPVFAVAFTVKEWAGTEFVYPNDHLPPLAAAVGFDLAPGASTVLKARWPAAAVPPEGSHPCWLATAIVPGETIPAGAHTWERNNLAQKNLRVVDLVAGDSILVPFRVGNLLREPGQVSLEVRRRPRLDLPVRLGRIHQPELLRELVDVADFSPAREAIWPPGDRASFGLRLRAGIEDYGLRVEAPKNAKPGETYDVDLVQRSEDGEVAGGIRVRVVVR